MNMINEIAKKFGACPISKLNNFVVVWELGQVKTLASCYSMMSMETDLVIYRGKRS